MTGTFKANNPYNNFLLFVYGFVLKLPMFINPEIPRSQQQDGILYRWIIGWLSNAGNSFPILYSFLAFILLYVQAIAFNKLLNDHRLLPKSNYLTGMSYLLITSLFTEWYTLSAPLIINTLLIWLLSQLFDLYNNPNAKKVLFNVGLVTGITTLFYFPSIAFCLLIIVSLIITRPFHLPEWIIAFIGLITPYYFLMSWFFLTNRGQYFFPGINLSYPKFHETAWAYVAIIFVLIIVAIGMFLNQNNMRRLVVQSRKSWNLLYLYLLVAMLVPFLNAGHRFDYWILAALPVSAFAASAFLFPEKKWFAVSMHWSLVALTVVLGYFVR